MEVMQLTCVQCGHKHPIDKPAYRCERCGDALEAPFVGNGTISGGNPLGQSVLERYRAFFPFLDVSADPMMGEGFTPLTVSVHLEDEFEAGTLFFKNESQNPTWSFKDRGTATGVIHAKNMGYKRIGTVSSGNMAVSVAAYGSRAGLATLVMVSSQIPEEKISPIAFYGPCLVRVEGDYSKMYDTSLEVGRQLDICFINSDAPMRVAGYKTLAFELCEQFDFDPPEFVIVPTSAGGHIRGIARGFEEFRASGLIPRIPTLVCAQADGCSPIHRAFSAGDAKIQRFGNPHTIAHAIENPFPPSGNAALAMLRGLKGFAVSATDDEILAAQRQVGSDGLFVQPASALALAAARKIKKLGLAKGGDRIVCVLTGSGLKYTAALAHHNLQSHQCTLEAAPAFIAGLL